MIFQPSRLQRSSGNRLKSYRFLGFGVSGFGVIGGGKLGMISEEAGGEKYQ